MNLPLTDFEKFVEMLKRPAKPNKKLKQLFKTPSSWDETMPNPITPEQLAKSGSEHGHQAAIFCWCANTGITELKWLFAIPNQTVGAIRGGRMVAEGMKSGVPDMMLPIARRGYLGMFMELKVKARKTKPNQDIWLEGLQNNGYYVCVAMEWEEAVEKLKWYMGIV